MTGLRLGVRGRAAMLAAGVVTGALVIGGVLILTLLRTSLVDSLDRTLTQQAADRVRLLEAGSAPADLVDQQQDEAFAWIGAPDGQLVAVGGALTPLEPPTTVEPGSTGTISLLVEETHRGESEVEVEEHDLRLASRATADGSRIVVVGSEIESVDKTVGVVRRFMVAGGPVLVLLVGGLAWISAGRALAPVDDIRRRAATISGASIDERVPVPEGRDEIHDLALTMNDMLDRLDEHQGSIRRFTADAGHELKSPMANIRALVETVDPGGESWGTHRDRLVAESDRAAALVDDLLFLAARDEGAGPPLRRSRVHLDDLVFDEAERLAATGGVAVDIDDVAPAPVEGDRVLLDRVLRNLTANAARHADSAVRFGSGVEEGTAVLTVSDDGPGIPPEQREAVFERFHRVDGGRGRDSGGTGLGLAIARRIVEEHGGSVSVGDRPGGGALLTVRLPVGEEHPAC